MKTLQQIINEADILVPNVLTTADKVAQLNVINEDFFNVVKIPLVHQLLGDRGINEYTLPNNIKAKNIEVVKFGIMNYKNAKTQDFKLTENYFIHDDNTHKLFLSKPSYRSGLMGFVHYYDAAKTTFTQSELSAAPDAPTEYHGSFVPALAAWIALTQDDGIKASMFEAQYKTMWNVAAQNYQRE